MRSPLTVGAGVKLYINGAPYARVSSLSINIATPRRDLKTVDTLSPWELLPTALSVSGTLQIYRLHNDGGAEGAGMSGGLAKLPREKYFSLLVINSLTDTVIFQSQNCSVDSQSWDIPAKSYITGRIAFSALDYNNEAE
jgi:hypothetical protein